MENLMITHYCQQDKLVYVVAVGTDKFLRGRFCYSVLEKRNVRAYNRYELSGYCTYSGNTYIDNEGIIPAKYIMINTDTVGDNIPSVMSKFMRAITSIAKNDDTNPQHLEQLTKKFTEELLMA